MKKLAIITTHPIQYYAPVFQLLHKNRQIEIKVFYTWGESALHKYDPGFNKLIDWDIPLLNGYPYEWANNTAKDPGSHHSKGIVNPDLIAQINLWQADAILVFGWAYHSHLRVMRHFKNKLPVYFRGDSTLLDEQHGWRSVLKTLWLRWVYSYIDHTFYVGTNNKAYFKKYGLKDNQLSFAPHAVDNDRFVAHRAAEALELRTSLGLTADELLITFAGKLEEKKSPALLLEAFLALDNPAVHLLFVGNGAQQKQLQNQAAGQEHIHFIDFKNQSYMPVVYQAADIFCLPSKGPGETWGLAINEAMACGRAIIASDKCGCAIDLVTNTNGVIFKSGLIDDLTSALKSLISNPDLVNEYGRRSKAIISDWSFALIAAAIEQKLINEPTNK